MKPMARFFLDTAPVIYFVEQHPTFAAQVEGVFARLERGEWTAVVSPVTLAECLVLPYRQGNQRLAKLFFDLLTGGPGIEFFPLDETIAEKAAALRARYGVTLADALQLACALTAGCEFFLTNDVRLQGVSEMAVRLVTELER